MTLPVRLSLVLMFPAWLGAAEYFVTKEGNDSYEGTSRAAAFLTVQKGVDVLSPGDTLTIGPGEYAESVQRKNLGSAEKETLIRAELPGTVLLRGDVKVGPFRKAEGFQFVYQAECPQEVHAVTEVDTMAGLSRMPNLAELDAAPGRWNYDTKSKILSISATDWNPAVDHPYLASVIQGDGLYLESPTRVVLDGLAATGFNNSHSSWAPAYRYANNGMKVVWGILLFQAKDCVVRNCTVYFNGGGIAVSNGQGADPKLNGRGNLVDSCVAYGNHSQVSSYESSGVGIYFPANDEIRNCYAYKNDAFGTRMYGQLAAPSKITETMSWGNWGNLGDFQLKVGGPGARVENCVSLGGFSNILDSVHSITGKEPTEYPQDNISLLPRGGTAPDFDRGFADAANFDFRLQSDSQFRGSAPDGKDRGPKPYSPDVFYVSPEGNDEADGLSMRQAWKTLARAVKNLSPGDTVYLEGGDYDGNLDVRVKGTADKPISFRGRGRKPVKISGAVHVTESACLDFQRIHFTDTVRLDESRDIRFDQCGFSAATCGLEATQVDGLRITHCQFTRFGEAGIVLRPTPENTSPLSAIIAFFQGAPAARPGGTKGVFLSGNFFDNASGPAIKLGEADGVLYSGYNGYRQLAKSWELDGKPVSPEMREQFPREITAKFALVDGVPVPENSALLAEGGPLGKPLGPYRDEMSLKQSRLASPPAVHSVSATTANVDWKTSAPASCALAWGDTPECKNTAIFDVNHVGSYSLTGLKPGQTYYFRLNSLSLPGALEREFEVNQVPFTPETISFTTLKENAAPVTFYVAPDGKDDNTGLDRQNALRTIAQAAAKVNAGDTVLVAGGIYPERVRLRATGDTGALITFKAMPGEKAVLDGQDCNLNNAFVATGKTHLRFDGFTFENYNLYNSQGWLPGQAGEFNLYEGRDIAITRCFSDGRSGYTAAFVTASHIENLLIKNCVLLNKFVGINLEDPCPNARIENSVFVGTMISHLILQNRPASKAALENNIFTDNIPVKAFGNIAFLSVVLHTVNRNNCFYLRSFNPPEKRTPIEEEATKTFTYYIQKGIIVDALFADPRFAGVSVPDPKFVPIYDMGYALDTSPDRLVAADLKLSFPDFFATNPDVVKRQIGLIPQDFEDFQIEKNGTPVVSAPAN